MSLELVAQPAAIFLTVSAFNNVIHGEENNSTTIEKNKGFDVSLEVHRMTQEA